MIKPRHLFLPLAILLTACAPNASPDGTEAPASGGMTKLSASPKITIDTIADSYVRLTLEAGTHEAEYVDAYYGPASYQDEAKASPRSLPELITEAQC